MNIRRTLTYAAALAISAPLIATSTTAYAASDPDTPSPSSDVRPCKGKQLKVSLGRTSGAAGTLYRNIRFRNTGKRCEVHSWPKVRYATKRGVPVGFLASHRRKPPRDIVLRHRERGKVALGTPAARNFPRRVCQPVRAAKIATYIPGRLRQSTYHLDKIPHGPMKVCTTKRGRPDLSRMR